MKILSFFNHRHLVQVMEKLKRSQELSYKVQCHHHTGCICLDEKAYLKHEKWLKQFAFHAEDNVKIRLHAMKDEVPWGVEDVKAPRKWIKGMGEGIKIAVIDTGINASHPDLKGQVKGRVNTAGRSLGINGHGTHVAGIIAAAMNDYGIVGVAPRAHLYDVRAFSADGTANLTDIISGLEWSIKNKMDIVNMSFGIEEYSKALENAVKAAKKAGVVLVASAGNNGGAVEYPARFPEVIGVGAIDPSHKLADFSSRGPGMNVKAPGVEIRSTWLGKEYRVLSGTSMAAPHIAGLIALNLGRKRKKS